MDVTFTRLVPRHLGRAGELLTQFGDGAVREDPAPAHDHHPRREPFDLRQVVAGHQHGGGVIDALEDEIVHPRPGGRVQTRGRFIEDQQLRFPQENSGEVNGPALASREPSEPNPGLVLQTDHAQHFSHG